MARLMMSLEQEGVPVSSASLLNHKVLSSLLDGNQTFDPLSLNDDGESGP